MRGSGIARLFGGLDETEQLQLFQKRGLPVEGEAGDYLRRIGKLYEGHPLVLRVIAEDLKDCGGDVERYWQQCRFDDLEANRPAKLSCRKLQLEVKQRVKASLERLPEDARQLLCRASVYRRPIPEGFWLAMLPERTETQQEAALNLLKARAFAEEDWEPNAWLGIDKEIPLHQHNLIRSVVYEVLKANESNWETAECKAAEMWLTAYEPIPDVPNLEKVRGYLEAFYHFCEIKDWEKASDIYMGQTKLTQHPFHRQLLIWGDYKELLRVSSKLSGKITSRTNVICVNQIGNAYGCLGDIKKAIEAYQKALNFAREINDRQGEGQALGNLGTAYKDLGNYAKAIECHQKALAISREIGDRQREGAVLGNLGITYRILGSYSQAIDCHQKYLAIAREIGDRQGESYALGNLGTAHYNLGNYVQMIDCHQKYLAIAREIGDRRGESKALGNLGIGYKELGNYVEVIEFHQQALEIAREIGDRQWQSGTLGNLGTVYYNLEQYSEALENLQASLKMFREIGQRSGEAEALKKLAELYLKMDEFQLAQEYCDLALTLANDLGIALVEECCKLKEHLKAAENSEA